MLAEFFGMFFLARIKKPKSHKEKNLTQGAIISQIEGLEPGESASYRLPKAFGNQVATVAFNTGYPWRGNKYTLSTQVTENAESTAGKEQIFEADEAKGIATWLYQRRGKFLHLAQD